MTFEKFVDKMLHDKAFRQAIAKDPKAELNKIKAHPTDEQVNALLNIDYKSLQRVAKAFGDDEVT